MSIAKRTKRWLVLVFIFLYFISVNAQTYDDLTELAGFQLKVFYSPGNEARTKTIAERCEKAIKYGEGLVGFAPKVSLLVLNPEHWKKYATSGPYGMPHYTDDETLVVASEDNDFWKSFIPPLDQLPVELATKIKGAYTTADGSLSMMAFFDLLAIHELGHGFHLQGGLTMQRLWMQELFVNIMLHTYIAENEPQNLPALEVFPEMVVASGTNGYEFTTLDDFEKRYSNMNPNNYGWYQCRLHVAGKNIYNSGGEDTFIKLWNGLKENSEIMNDEQLITFLKKEVHNEVAKVQTDW